MDLENIDNPIPLIYISTEEVNNTIYLKIFERKH